ncbi:hypothetical protein DMENIID0001_127340 [Sergentomyia squamirostris]
MKPFLLFKEFGQDVMQLCKEYSRTTEKLALCKSRRYFLLQCNQKNLFPKHIITKVNSLMDIVVQDSPFIDQAFLLMDTFKRKILKLEIKITHWRLSMLSKKRDECYIAITDSMGTHFDIQEFFKEQKWFHDRILSKKIEILNNKISVLVRQEEEGAFTTVGKQKFLVNTTDVELPYGVTELLSLGPKFVLPGQKIPIFHIIADIEEIVGDVEESVEKDELRTRMVNLAQNGLTRPRKKTPADRIVQRWEKETKSFVEKESQRIVIIEADKGNITTIMDKGEYVSKMRALIADERTYKKERHDPTSRLQKANNDIVSSLHEKDHITLLQKRRMTTYCALAPKIYGTPKVHKAGYPLRPVVAYVGSPNYHLAKMAADILRPLGNSHFNVKNSRELVEFLRSEKLQEEYVLISLDVVALFTNVPINMIEQEVERRYDEVSTHTTINKIDFMKILKLCLTSGYFVFQGEYYTQIDGVAMGSPISPITADIVMQHILDTAMDRTTLRVGFIKKYVDDLLVSVHRDDVDSILGEFNGVHPKIQFTMEREENGVIPYLDVEIHRDESGALSTVWYSKAIASGRMLNYNSRHPRHMILNVARNFVRRVTELTTKDNVNIKNMITPILQRNDYPPDIIRRLLRTNVRRYPERVEPDPQTDPPHYHTLNYVKGTSEEMKILVKSSLPSTCKVALRPKDTVQQTSKD